MKVINLIFYKIFFNFEIFNDFSDFDSIISILIRKFFIFKFQKMKERLVFFYII